ncbi:MAG: TonB family protein [Gemmatimonadaceae bacterium]
MACAGLTLTACSSGGWLGTARSNEPSPPRCQGSQAASATTGVPVVPDSALGKAFGPPSTPRSAGYPQEAAQASASGVVAVDFQVDTSGRVDPCSVRIVEVSARLSTASYDQHSGISESTVEGSFARAVRHYLARSRWPPPRLDRRPVHVQFRCVAFRFSADGGPPVPTLSRCTPTA